METEGEDRVGLIVKIALSREEESRLRERTERRGVSVERYVQGLVEKDLSKRPSLKQILAPLHADFRRSGMTDEDLEMLLEEARQEAWEERARKYMK